MRVSRVVFSIFFTFLLQLLLPLAQVVEAQTDPYAGIPPFSSIDGSQFDTIDLATSNVFIKIPVRSKAGKTPFAAASIGSSHVYSIQTSTASWNLGGTWVGGFLTIAGQMSWGYSYAFNAVCGADQNDNVYGNWFVTDSTGAAHPFPNTVYVDNDGCYPAPNGGMYATDGSGYALVLAAALNPFGGTISGTVYDRHGNKLTTTGIPSSITYTYTDADNVVYVLL